MHKMTPLKLTLRENSFLIVELKELLKELENKFNSEYNKNAKETTKSIISKLEKLRIDD